MIFYFGPRGSGGPTAATFVVDPSAGVGDYTDIQTAVNNLPDEGGMILVREGTYNITSTISLPDKPVVIRGCGNGSIINLGANAIVAFTVPNILTEQRDYAFEDLLITGTEGTANYAWRLADTDSLGRIHALRVKTDGIQKIVDFNAGRTFSDGNFFFASECWFRPNADGSSQLSNTDGAGSFFNNTVFLDKCWYIRDDGVDGVFGKLCEDGSPNTDFIMNGSVLALSGINDTGAFCATDTVFHADSAADPLTFISCYGSFNAYLTSGVRNCEFRSIHMEFFEEGGSILGSRFDNCEILGIAEQFYMLGNTHVSNEGTLGSQLVTIDSGVVAFSRFESPADPGVAWCIWADASKIIGNTLDPSGAGEAALRVSQDCYISGNTFTGASGSSIPPVREVFGSNNVYSDNVGYDPQGVASPSVFTNTNNIYQGVANRIATGTATTTLTTILQYLNRNGITPTKGLFRNTGGTAIDVTENWTPVVGAPANRTTNVAGGASFVADPFNPPGGTNPPFTLYTIQIRTAAGTSGYALNMPLPGGTT